MSVTPPDESPFIVTIFMYYDHFVDPSVSMSKKFSIPTLFQMAHITRRAIFTSDDVNKFNSIEERLQKVLYLVSTAKNSEIRTERTAEVAMAVRTLKSSHKFSKENAQNFAQMALNDIFDEIRRDNPELKDVAIRDTIKANDIVVKALQLWDDSPEKNS